jgi:hypothetical protein
MAAGHFAAVAVRRTARGEQQDAGIAPGPGRAMWMTRAGIPANFRVALEFRKAV